MTLKLIAAVALLAMWLSGMVYLAPRCPAPSVFVADTLLLSGCAAH